MTAELTFNLIISLLVPILVGYAGCLIIFKKSPFNFLTSLSVSFGLGVGVIAQWMLFLSIIGINFSRTNVLFPLLTMSLLVFFYSRWKKGKDNVNRKNLTIEKKGRGAPFGALNLISLRSILGVIIFIYVVFQLYFMFWRALNVPIHSWDAIYVIASKAKCLFYEGSVAPLRNYNLSSYPLQIPLSMAWVALNLGIWEEQLVKIIFPTFFLSYLAIHYDFLLRFTNKWWALLGLGLLVSANFPVYHATIAYRDIFLMCYNMSSAIFIVMGCERKNDSFFILAGLFAGFAAFTKLEAAGYCLINSLAFLYILFTGKEGSLREKSSKFIKFITPCLVIFLIYFFYRHFNNIEHGQGRFLLGFTHQSFNRIEPIFMRFFENLFVSGNWNILWLILAVSLLVHRAKVIKNLQVKFFSLLLFLYFALYFAIALLTPNFISIAGSHSYTVLSRIVLHFFPLCPLLIIFLNYKNGRKDHDIQ